MAPGRKAEASGGLDDELLARVAAAIGDFLAGGAGEEEDEEGQCSDGHSSD